MKGIKLHNHFARRREAQHVKIEQSAAVNRYYDKWGRITSRYDTWTTPEYYQQAEEAVRQSKRDQEKSVQLERRRNLLRDQLDRERVDEELALKELKRPKSKSVANSILSDIHSSFRRLEEERRRISLESGVYKQYRLSDREDVILHDSRSDHEAMAKMNWLDKQVMLQMERESEKRAAEERTIRLQEEARKHREHLDERRTKRGDEINDLKQFQDSHMAELNAHNQHSDTLRRSEANLRHCLTTIEQEQRQINRNIMLRAERFKETGPFNVRRIKLAIRNRSEAICSDLRDDTAILDRLEIGGSSEQITVLRDMFQQKLDEEKRRQMQVDAMYESEAKQMLATQERVWADEAANRTQRLTHIVDEHCKVVQNALTANLEKQRDVVNIKETHLSAIRMANDRLKDLQADQRKDEVDEVPRYDDCLDKSNQNGRNQTSSNGSVVDSLRKCSITSGSSMSSELSVPKFGRKKIAWT